MLVAECLRRGLWEDLDPVDLATCVASLVYESRLSDDAFPRVPDGASADTLAEMERLWGELHEVERDHRVSFLREPDLGFVWTAHRWARGDRLDRILMDADMPAGDFVRTAKQPDAAIALVEWLSSEAAQGQFAEVNQEYPANPAVSPSAEVAAWGDFRADDIHVEAAGRLQGAAIRLMDRSGYR
jgi:hypothetical protein